VSFKPNSTNILVQSLSCTGSHGISVGSLGQYAGQFDIVEDIYVANISMHNASDGARIKVWPNTPSALSGDLQYVVTLSLVCSPWGPLAGSPGDTCHQLAPTEPTKCARGVHSVNR